MSVFRRIGTNNKGDLMFCRNVGKTDRLFRMVLGLGLITMVFVGPKTALGWIGIIPLATAMMGFCPLYPVFSINTCKKD
jgi:hypothetical protein